MNKLTFGDIEVSEKEFYESKKAVNLSEVDINKIFVSNKIKGNNETSNFLMAVWMILVVLLDLYVLFYHKCVVG